VACAVICNYYYYYDVFRVSCAVIFNCYDYYEYSFGWHARLFLITTTTTSSFFRWRALLFLITTTTTSSCFPSCVRCYFHLLILLRVVFCFRVACSVVIFNDYYYYEQFCFGWRARLFLITSTTTSSFVFGWRARLF